MASGDTIVTFLPDNCRPVDASGAGVKVRNTHPYIMLPSSGTPGVDWSTVLPGHYGGGGFTLNIVWMAATATTGTVRFSGKWERHQDDVDDLDSDSFATAQTGDGSPASAAGEPQYTTTLTFTNAQIDGLLVNEHFRFRLERDTTVGGNMTGDCEVLAVEVQET